MKLLCRLFKLTLEQENELSLDSENKAKLIKLRREINRLSKKLKFASNLNPVTNATVEALEEVFKQTGGILAAMSSERHLINSLLFSSGKRANTDLLMTAREGGYIRSNRVGRVGYSGYCSAAIFCLAQENVITAIIEASDVSGLFERFIPMSEPDRVGWRDHLNVVLPDKELLEIYERKFDFFEKVLEDGFHPDRLITLQISHSDWLNIHHIENEFEVQLKPGAKYAHPIMRRFISKVRMHVMSLACNLFLLEEEAPDSGCYVPSGYVLSAIYMMKQIVEGLYAYCISQGIISNHEQIKVVFDLFVKHKDGLTMHEIKKKSEGLRVFKDLPNARKTIEDVVRFLTMNNVLLYTNNNSYIKNPLA
jgi:hypothetical protein